MTSSSEAILSIARQRILILDGAMGTAIQKRKLNERDFRGARFQNHGHEVAGNNDLISLTQPELLAQIHDEYLAAGADIIETNTFSSTRIAQEDYGLSSVVYDLNYEAARLAKACATRASDATPKRPRFVAGALGPTNRTLSISPKVEDPGFRAVTFDQMREAYAEQTRGLIEGGVDILMPETVFDTLNLKACLCGIWQIFDELKKELPLIISVTVTDRSGRTLSGQTIEAFWASIAHAKPLAVGLNCALGAEEMRPYVEELSRLAPTLLSCYPNAGLPNAFGEYDETPEQMAGSLSSFAKDGLVNLLGGCCGTTPEHIRRLAAAVQELAPRQIPDPPRVTRYAGLEPLVVDGDSNFIMVGERTNVTGSRRFARLIKNGDFGAALEVAASQVRNGANIIDVNMDEAMLDSEASMVQLLESRLPSEPAIARRCRS